MRNLLLLLLFLTLCPICLPGNEGAVSSTHLAEHCWYGESLSEWQPRGTMQGKLQDGILHLQSDRPGACIDYCGPRLDLPGEYTLLEIEYRAIRVPEKNNGFLMFGVVGAPFGQNSGIRWFENIRTDGKFQLLRLNLDGHAPRWSDAANIDKLRICIPQQPPFEVEIRCIRLLSEHPVQTPRGPCHCFPIGEGDESLEIRLPEGRQNVYLECRGDGAPHCSVTPPLEQDPSLGAIVNGRYRYLPLGRTGGGTLQIKPDKDARICGIVFTNDIPARQSEPPVYPSAPSELTTVLQKAELPFHYYTGYMVRAQQDVLETAAKGRNQFAFRRDFELPEGVRAVQIQLSVDDHYVLYWNGVKILESHIPDGWRSPKRRIITELCRPGLNRMEGVYHNSGGPGGMTFELEWIDAKGEYHSIGADRELLFAAKEQNDWKLPEDGTVPYLPGVLQSTPPNPPWTTVLPFRKLSLEEPPPVLHHGIIRENGRSFWEFRSAAKASPGARIDVKLTTPRGMELYREVLTIDESMVPQAGLFRLPIRMPKFASSGKFVLHADTKELALPSGLSYEFEYENSRVPGKRHDFRVKDGMVLRDGKPIPVIFGNSFQDFAAAKYEKIPLPFRIVWTATTPVVDWWTADGQYDFSVVDAKVDACLQVDENVELLIFMGINPPIWWGKENPDELAKYADGTSPATSEAPVSFASMKFRSDATEAMLALVRHIRQSPYADKVAGFVPVCGYTGEFQHWDSFRGNGRKMFDYSQPAREGFAKSMREILPQGGCELPSPEERLAERESVLLDPREDTRLILHSRYHSRIVADSLEHFVKALRREVGEGFLIGAYYGYTMEYANMGLKLHNAGHNCLAQILALPEIDFLMSPPSYGVRGLGESGEDMKPFASIRAAGKLSVVDDDTRTERIGRPVGFFQTVNARQTRNVLRRTLGRTLCRQEVLSLLSLTSGNEFSSDESLRDIRRTLEAEQFSLTHGIRPNAEIAVVVSEKAHDATVYSDEFHPEKPDIQEYNGDGTVRVRARTSQPLTADLVYYQRNQLARLGAPADWLLAEDLARVAKRPYKLWIFLNAYAPDKQFLDALEEIRKGGGKMLFVYAAGGLEMPRLSGMEVAPLPVPMKARMVFPDVSHPALSLMRTAPEAPVADIRPLFHVKEEEEGVIPLGWYENGAIGCAVKGDAIFIGNPRLSPDFVRSVARYSGVHLFSEDNDVLYANNAFVAIHAVTAGRKTISLPHKCDVYDLFENKLLARDVTEVSFPMDLHETKVLYYDSLGHGVPGRRDF